MRIKIIMKYGIVHKIEAVRKIEQFSVAKGRDKGKTIVTRKISC